MKQKVSLEERTSRSTTGLASERVSREDRLVALRLVDGSDIRGTVHIVPGSRVFDLLNRGADSFIAVTDARMSTSATTEPISFIAVNKAHIVSLRELPDR